MNFVSKRFFVTLPDAIGDALDRWAEAERNKPASLAAFLLEKIIREAIDQGKVPDPSVTENAEVKPDEFGERAKQYAKALATGAKIDIVDLVKLANDLGVEPDALSVPLKQRKGKITNGH